MLAGIVDLFLELEHVCIFLELLGDAIIDGVTLLVGILDLFEKAY